MRTSNYDKFPSTTVHAPLWKGWCSIQEELTHKIAGTSDKKQHILVIECYHGVLHDEVIAAFSALSTQFFTTSALFKSPEEIEELTRPYLTDDRLFGRRAPLTYADYFESEKVAAFKGKISTMDGLIIVYGHGAAELIDHPDTLVYADMARWEIQQRFRKELIDGLGVLNRHEAPSLHYKRGYFLDWIVCDTLKKKVLPQADYWLDTHKPNAPAMISGESLRAALEQTVHSPFRVVPFFDPAPWGGQWMKEVCGLDKEKENFGWCFDCVPEENSLYLNIDGTLFELAANTLVFAQTENLLGAAVEARFGQDFPIRFDFLDTMGGGNLSLQVHPTTQYIRDHFGIYYTQDESYYLLDAEENATVYLGLKSGIDSASMISDLRDAQKNGTTFPTEKYVNQWPAKKHDHYLIPAGTVHCSGSGAMVLEISATPSIFTFKLWDWNRLGLDGLPRPINIEHGKEVIKWERDTEFTRQELVNVITPIAEGDVWREERTGLHVNEFIETRRHWFSQKVLHNTGGSVNVLNLIEGEEVIIESPTLDFPLFIVHYAETFIIPACIGNYTIRPYGRSEGCTCGTIKAYVRHKQ